MPLHTPMNRRFYTTTPAILDWPIAKQASRAPDPDGVRQLNVTIVRGYDTMRGGPNVAAQVPALGPRDKWKTYGIAFEGW